MPYDGSGSLNLPSWVSDVFSADFNIFNHALFSNSISVCKQQQQDQKSGLQNRDGSIYRHYRDILSVSYRIVSYRIVSQRHQVLPWRHDCQSGRWLGFLIHSFITDRTDRRIFNLSRLAVKSKITELLARDLLYGDDCAMVAHSRLCLKTRKRLWLLRLCTAVCSRAAKRIRTDNQHQFPVVPVHTSPEAGTGNIKCCMCSLTNYNLLTI